MIIASGTSIQMASQRLYLEQHSRNESLRAWSGQQRLEINTKSESLHVEAGSQQTITSQNPQGKEGERRAHPAPLVPFPFRFTGPAFHRPDRSLPLPPASAPQQTDSKGGDDHHKGPDSPQDLHLSILKMVVERLTGKRLELFDAKQLEQGADPPPTLQDPTPSHAQPASSRQGAGFVYQAEERRSEVEVTTFAAQGVIKTADGQEVAFQVDLQMSRAFVEENRLEVRGGAALKDPLVINFGGKAAELTETRFQFDLDADGQTEAIPFVKAGSGFLALDKNGDGVVNDGSELFGPTTGNGFTELAQHDQDGNGWIDEADAVYSRLGVWTRVGETDKLTSLAEAGVGAISLQNVATPFQMKGSANQLQGVVQSTGLFVAEAGSVGTVQQVDLVV